MMKVKLVLCIISVDTIVASTLYSVYSISWMRPLLVNSLDEDNATDKILL